MKLIKVFLILFLLSLNLKAQEIEEKVLIPDGKASNDLFEGDIIRTTLQGSYGYTALEYVPMEEGFLRRNDFTFQYFNSSGEKVWEKKIESLFTLRQQPKAYTTASNSHIYFFEHTLDKIKKYRVNQFDIKTGETKSFTGDLDIDFKGIQAFFASSSGMHFLWYKADDKAKSMEYRLGTFNSSDLSHNSVRVDLPTEDKGETLFFEPVYINKRELLWKINDSYKISTDKVRLIKYYKTKLKGESYLVCESLLMDNLGKVTEHIKAKFTDPSSEYEAIQAIYNEKKQELLAVGYKDASDAIEFLKFDQAGNIISKKELSIPGLSKQTSAKILKSWGQCLYKKVFVSIFYDALNDSYLFVDMNPLSFDGYILHISADLDLARIDKFDRVYTYGLGPVQASSNVHARSYEMLYEHYNGSSGMLMIGLKKGETIFKNDAASYDGSFYDRINNVSNSDDWKKQLFFLLNLENKKSLIVENEVTSNVKVIFAK